MKIVYWFEYGSNGEYCVVFAPQDRAEYVAQIYRALRDSETWGEFKGNLPEGEWDRYFTQVFDETPDEDEAFDADEVPGHPDGDYPPWLTQEQLGWFPDELIRKHGGEVGLTVLNGPSLNLPSNQAEAIAEDLRSMGHTVEETTLVFE
jgi:hypothetical protein